MAQIEIYEEINAGIIIAKTNVNGNCYAVEIDSETIDCEYMLDNAGDESIGWEQIEDIEFSPDFVNICDVVGDGIALAPTLNLERIGNAGREFIGNNIEWLSDSDLGLVARQVDNWMHPVFHEIESRAGVKMELNESYEDYMVRCGEKIGIELF